MAFKIMCGLTILVVFTEGVTIYYHAFSSQHIHRYDGSHQKVYILEHKHKPPRKEVHKHSEHKPEEHKKEEHKGKEQKQEIHLNYYAHPKYEYGYKVLDYLTGDKKSQHEHRDGDSVKGYFELQEPGGSLRHVKYHADYYSGFHADVKHNTHHIVPKKHN